MEAHLREELSPRQPHQPTAHGATKHGSQSSTGQHTRQVWGRSHPYCRAGRYSESQKTMSRFSFVRSGIEYVFLVAVSGPGGVNGFTESLGASAITGTV